MEAVDPNDYDTRNYTITTLGSNTTYTVTVDSENDSTFRYCFQDMLRSTGRSFPAIPEFQPEGGEWMTEDQERVTTLYGWTSVGVLAIVIVSVVGTEAWAAAPGSGHPIAAQAATPSHARRFAICTCSAGDGRK